MIISDLNYLENTSEEVIGGYDFTASKNVAIVANITETINISKNVTSNLNLSGYLATAEGQAYAVGNATVAEVYSFSTAGNGSSAANSLSISAAK
ncbi:hypothetical protein [Nostoc sp.]|uniref:hypothetical protein n=1 Tax=Nostoc sp. TaxID=1180 RepID=UPI002FF5F6DB